MFNSFLLKTRRLVVVAVGSFLLGDRDIFVTSKCKVKTIYIVKEILSIKG